MVVVHKECQGGQHIRRFAWQCRPVSPLPMHSTQPVHMCARVLEAQLSRMCMLVIGIIC